VAAFCYAALHTVFYLISEQTLGRVLEELPRFDIWTGWLAFLIFLPLAATSMNYAVRKLGPRWKLSYPARAHRFAQAIGQGAKTDRVDAAMLSRI
jgi:sulfoxide reductase heme-binding subunit YedZ